MKCMVCSVDNGNVDLATMSAQSLKNIPMFLNVGQIAPLAIDFADAPHSKRERSCVLSLKLVVHNIEKGNGRGSIRRACPKKKILINSISPIFFAHYGLLFCHLPSVISSTSSHDLSS